MTNVNKAATASVPINSGIAYKNSIELKKEYVLFKAKTQADNIRQNVADYHKRMAEFRENHAKEIKQENNEEIQKKIKSIQNISFGNDVTKLLSGNSQINSLLNFAHYNIFDSSLKDALYTAKKQKGVIEDKITKIKNGQADNTEVKVDPDLKEFTQRDLLA